MSEPDTVLARPHQATTLLAVALMISAGLRVGEVVSIRCEDIDLVQRQLRVTGKGRRERQVFLTNAWITELAGAYLRTRRALDVDQPELLFNMRRRPVTTDALRSRIAKAVSAAALDTKVTPHMLRHSAATQLIECGVDIRLIQRLLGHASLRTTAIYTHVSDDHLMARLSDVDVLGRLQR